MSESDESSTTKVEPTEQNVGMAVLAKLNDIDSRLKRMEENRVLDDEQRVKLTKLTEAALTALATESRNAADIRDLRRRVDGLEDRVAT